MKKIRVLLVDDHKIIRQGLRRLLELDEGIEVVGEAETGEAALAEVATVAPDVVLMDIRLSGMDGIEATRQLKQAYSEIKVIVLSSYTEDYVPEAIEAGALGYMLKSVSYEELSQAIRSVHAGQATIDGSLVGDLFRRVAELGQAGRDAGLSQRQLQILRLLASGLGNKEITGELFISSTTLKRELRHIFNKLGASTRAQAVAEAYKRRLL